MHSQLHDNDAVCDLLKSGNGKLHVFFDCLIGMEFDLLNNASI